MREGNSQKILFKETTQGWTRYSIKNILSYDVFNTNIICEVDARRCSKRGKTKGNEVCRSQFLRQGKCKKVKIILKEVRNTTVIVNYEDKG